MPTIEADFEVYCSECGAGLCNQTKTEKGRNGWCVNVRPCKACLEAARSEGYNDGHEAGIDEATPTE